MMSIFVWNDSKHAKAKNRADLVGSALVMRKWVFDCRSGHVDFEKKMIVKSMNCTQFKYK